jgi:Invasin, domain 3
MVSPHVVYVGEDISASTGASTSVCAAPGGSPGQSWSWPTPPGPVVSGCTEDASTCVFQATGGTGGWATYCMSGAAWVGSWGSCDYYGVVGGTATISVSVSPGSISADGKSTTTATAVVSDGGTPESGDDVSFSSSDPGQNIGTVTDNGDGSYTATITASKTGGNAAITASDTTPDPAVSATTTLTSVGATPAVSVKLSPSTVNVCGSTCSLAGHVSVSVSVSVTAADGSGLSGQTVSLSASDPGVSFSAVSDAGNGTYNALLTPSNFLGGVTVTATDRSASPAVSGTATLTQECNPGSSVTSSSADLRHDFAAAAAGAFSDELAAATSASSCPSVTINNAASLSIGGPLVLTGTGWSTASGAGPVSLYLTNGTGARTLIGTEAVSPDGSFTTNSVVGSGKGTAVVNPLTVSQWSKRATYPDFKDGCQLNLVSVQGTTSVGTSASVTALGGVVYYKGTSTDGYKGGDDYCAGENPLSESDGSLMVLAPNDGSASGSPVRLLVDDPDASITVHNGENGGVYLEPGHSLCIGVVGLTGGTSKAAVISASGGAATASSGASSSCTSSSTLNPAVASIPASTGAALDCGGLVAQYLQAQQAAAVAPPGSLTPPATWRARGNLNCTDHYFDLNLNFIDDFYVSSLTTDGNFRLDTKLDIAGSVAASGALVLGGGVSARTIAAGGDISLLRGPTPHLSPADKTELLKLSAFLTSREVGTPLAYLGVPVAGLGLVPPTSVAAGWVGAVLAVVGAKLVWDSNSLADLASDPPDHDFRAKTTATTPNFAPTVPHGGLSAAATKALDVLSANSARTLGLERALETAVDRAGGATDAGDTAAERSQLHAAGAFASKLAPLQRAFLRDLRAARRALSATHLATFKIPARAVERLVRATRRTGLPAATVRLLKRAGINSSQIAKLRSKIDALPKRSVRITFPTVTRQLATAVRRQVAILKAFAARMRTNPLAPVQP